MNQLIIPDLSVGVCDDAGVVAHVVGRGQLGDLVGEGVVFGRPRLQGEAVLEPGDVRPRAALGRALETHLQRECHLDNEKDSHEW